jgi:hypothetical protein
MPSNDETHLDALNHVHGRRVPGRIVTRPRGWGLRAGDNTRLCSSSLTLCILRVPEELNSEIKVREWESVEIDATRSWSFNDESGADVFLVIILRFRVTDGVLDRSGSRNCDGRAINVSDHPQTFVAAHGGPNCGLGGGGVWMRHKIWASGRSTHMSHHLRASVHVLSCLRPTSPTWTHTCPHKSPIPRPIALGPISLGTQPICTHMYPTCSTRTRVSGPDKSFLCGAGHSNSLRANDVDRSVSMLNLDSTC